LAFGRGGRNFRSLQDDISARGFGPNGRDLSKHVAGGLGCLIPSQGQTGPERKNRRCQEGRPRKSSPLESRSRPLPEKVGETLEWLSNPFGGIGAKNLRRLGGRRHPAPLRKGGNEA